VSKGRKNMIAALDIGTSKVCCLIAEVDEDGTPHVVGIGHQVAKGVKAGSIVDMEAARNAIRAAVHAAEEMADATMKDVFVSLSAGAPRSIRFDAEVPVAGHEIGAADLRRVIDQGCQWRNGESRQIVHAIPMTYSLDGLGGIRNPEGMVAQRLGVDMHLVTATTGAIDNLNNCLSGCYLRIEALAAASSCAGFAALTDDELELGAAVIDMGGGTTSIATFEEGELVFTGVVPIGGQHVTTDIAHGLSTPLADAERLKTLQGTTIPTSSDARRLLDVPQIADDAGSDTSRISRLQLSDIIRPRVEETFELVRDLLEREGPGIDAARRLVLTGGASQLEGARDVATEIFEAQVRLGRPARIAGLAQSVSGPAFSVAAGLLRYATTRHDDRAIRRPRKLGEPSGLIGRIGDWLHENF
jgi:cell division protein FtsA